MTTTNAQNVSQETFPVMANRFLEAWKDAVEIVGPSLFGCKAKSPQDATHWHQLTPKLDVMRRAIPNKSQVDAVFASAIACFYNASEGHKLLKKVGCEPFGNIAALLDSRRRAILAVLIANYEGWE